MELAREMGVDLTRGYLFRPTTPDLSIEDAPSTSSVAESRLKGYLSEMKVAMVRFFMGFVPAVRSL